MMKKTFFVALFTLAVPFSVLAATDFEEVPVQSAEKVDISQVDATEVWLRLDYPGHISGYCGLALDSTSPIGPVLEEFNFGKQPCEVSSNTAYFEFPRSRYVDWVTMNAVSGGTLKDVLSRLGTSLSAYAVPCEPNPEASIAPAECAE